MRRENYKSDIKLEVTLKLGGVPIGVPDHDFALHFFTEGDHRIYCCHHRGDEWLNCKAEGDKLICSLDNHHLGCGMLMCEYYDYAPDVDFADGNQLKVVPNMLDIELIEDAGDDATAISAEVAIDIVGALADVRAAVARLNELLANLHCSEDGFFYVDAAGNIAFKYTPADGFDAAKVSDHFRDLVLMRLVTSEDGFYYTDREGNIAFKYTPGEGFDAVKLSNHFKVLVLSLFGIDLEGFYYTDKEGNVAIRYTPENGLDAAKASNHFKELILSRLATTEDGLYYTDNEGNVAMQYTSAGFDVAKLSNHFKGLLPEGGGGSSPTSKKLSLLHISDNHHKNRDAISAAYGITKLKEILGEDDSVSLAMHTGDMGSSDAPYAENELLTKMIGALSEWNESNPDKPILMVKGNHDVIDSAKVHSGAKSGGGYMADAEPALLETISTNEFCREVNANLVTWGGDQPVVWSDSSVSTEHVGYWYKDIVNNEVKVRIIGLDEYQRSVGVPSNSIYRKIYSQAQIDWLIATLKSTPEDSYIILAHHQPVYDYHPENTVNDFTHHGIYGQEYYPGVEYDGSMFTYGVEHDVTVFIIDAYQHKRLWTSNAYPSGAIGKTLNIVADFRNTIPAKFACHLNGHVHGDFCEYVPGYPRQLSLTIMSDNPRASRYYESYSDVVRSTAAGSAARYAINKITIDAGRDVLKVERIGASELKSDSTKYIQDGSARKSIEFAISPIVEEPYNGEQVQSDWTEADSDDPAYIKNKPTLATVATSGSYNDLTNKPTIPAAQIQSDWSQSDNTKKDYIKNKPTIPAAQVNADWNAASGVAAILNKPTIPVVPTNVSAFVNDASYATTSQVATAVATKADKRTYVDNSADASVELSVTTYNDLGTLSTWKTITLPATYDRADEFVFRFVCNDASLTPTLPSGVVMADNFEWKEMAVGVVFQVSIFDGEAAYLCLTPQNP